MQEMRVVLIDEDREVREAARAPENCVGCERRFTTSRGSDARLRRALMSAVSPLLLGIDEGCWEAAQAEPIALSILTHDEAMARTPRPQTRYYILRPVDHHMVPQVLAGAARPSRDVLSDADRERIRTVCLRVGIPAHIQGFAYIQKAVSIVLLEPDAINAITRTLYPGVARWFGTTPSKVERSIRHAVNAVWKQGRSGALNDMFGYTVCNEATRLTNGEMIALLVELCQPDAR